jgi:hypothetical protein
MALTVYTFNNFLNGYPFKIRDVDPDWFNPDPDPEI